MIQGYTIEQVRQFYAATYGAGRARLYVVGRFDAAAMEAAIRKAFDGWAKGTPPQTQPPKPASSRAVHLVDRPGALQSTIILGMPTIDPSQRRFRGADGDGRAARRRLRLADHQEHPRGQGLHLLAVQRALDPLPRRLLGGERRRDHRADRRCRSRRSSPRSTGCRRSRRTRRSCTGSRTTWPAPTCFRTRAAAASPRSCSSWTCTACRPTTRTTT